MKWTHLIYTYITVPVIIAVYNLCLEVPWEFCGYVLRVYIYIAIDLYIYIKIFLGTLKRI